MSELIVIGYEGRFRAPEVLNELRRRDWDWVSVLDKTVVVSRDGQGELRIQFGGNPSTTDWAARARVWRAFLSLALLVPIAGVRRGDAGNAAGETGGGDLECLTPDLGWWTKTVGISAMFIRDVGSLIGPDDSALILLLPTSASGGPLRKLHDYGGTLLHTTLSPGQDAELKAALTPG